MVKKIPTTSSDLRILSASNVNTILTTLDLSKALKSQADVFTSFSHPKSPSSTSSTSTATESPLNVPGIQTPHRSTISSEEQTILFMPSRASSVGGTAIKIVSVPNKGNDGLPASTIIIDEKSGKVKGIVNARKLTALRNALGSALFLQSFPQKESPKNLVIFGSGAQALSHASVILQLFNTIKTCTFLIRKPSHRSASLLITLTNQFPNVTFSIGISMHPQPLPEDTPEGLKLDIKQIIHNANIIVTCTPSTEPLFDSVDVTSGSRLVCIGSYKPTMHEIETGLVKRSGIVVVDSREACAKEAGELIKADITGEGMVELGEILGDEKEVEDLRQNVVESGDVVLFKSVGLGIQDVAIANLVLQEAEEKSIGSVIPDYDE